jgi:hypothetical protein
VELLVSEWNCWFQSGIAGFRVELLVSEWNCWFQSGSAGFRVELLVSEWNCWFQSGIAGFRVELLVSEWTCWFQSGIAGLRVELLVSEWNCWFQSGIAGFRVCKLVGLQVFTVRFKKRKTDEMIKSDRRPDYTKQAYGLCLCICLPYKVSKQINILTEHIYILLSSPSQCLILFNTTNISTTYFVD